MKKLTIITITYNDLKNLRMTVQSVLEQMCDVVEYLVIDGASTDGTADYLRGLTGIRYISEPDRGIYDAMNKGIHLAEGEWVLFLNAGDVLMTNVLEKLLPELRTEDDCVYGNVLLTLEYQGKVYCRLEKAKDDLRELRKGMICSHQAFFCRRDDLMEVGEFDTTFRIAGDWDMISRLYVQGKRFRHLDMIIAVFKLYGASSKPHPGERHRVRKKNHLVGGVDVLYIQDLFRSVRSVVLKALLGEHKKKLYIIRWHCTELLQGAGYDRQI